jgi:hypothetical protein
MHLRRTSYYLSHTIHEAAVSLAVVRSKQHERSVDHFIHGAVKEELMGGNETVGLR